VVSHEHESRGISTVRSHYQAMTSEDTTEWEGSVCVLQWFVECVE
jgi:hypothetical protein